MNRSFLHINTQLYIGMIRSKLKYLIFSLVMTYGFLVYATDLSGLQKAISSNPKDNRPRIELAEIYKEKKDYQKIVDTLSPVSETLNRKGLLLLAEAFAGLKDGLNEVRVLEIIISQYPSDYVVLHRLGEAFVKIKKPDEAILRFREARQKNSLFLPAYESLLKILEAEGDRLEARTLITDMIAKFGEKPAYLTALCRLYAEDNFQQKAVESCKKAISKDPRVPENHVFLAMSLRDTENEVQAIKILEKAADQFPSSDTAQVKLAEYYLEKKNYEAAFKYYNRGVSANNKSAMALYGVATSGLEINKYAEALSALKSACKFDRFALRETRVAVGKVRKKNMTAWIPRYEETLAVCGN